MNKTVHGEIDWSAPDLWKRLPKDQAADTVNPGFLDGGIFDNEPIRLAYTLARNGLVVENGHSIWKKNLTTERGDVADSSMIYAYLNPGNTLYPKLGQTDSTAADDIVEMAFKVIPAMAGASIRNELFTLLEENDKLGEHMFLTENHSLHMSGYMHNFFGFFEYDFRVFDFYLGIYDAERTLRHIIEDGRFLKKVIGDRKINFPAMTYYWPEQPEPERANFFSRTFLGKQYKEQPSDLQMAKKVIEQKARPLPEFPVEPLRIRGEYLLLKKVLDSIYSQVVRLDVANPRFSSVLPDTALLNKCDADFTILLQTSLDRLWARWRCAFHEQGPKGVSRGSYDPEVEKQWEKIIALAPQPPCLLSGLSGQGHEAVFNRCVKLIEQENEEDALIYLLQEYSFAYNTVGRGQMASNEVAQAMLADFSYFAFNTINNAPISWLEKYIVWPMGTMRSLNFYYYIPKDLTLFGTYRAGSGKGGWEVGTTLRIFQIPFGYARVFSNLRISGAYFGSYDALYGSAAVDFGIYSTDRTAKRSWWCPSRLLLSGPLLQPAITAGILYGNFQSEKTGDLAQVTCTGVMAGYSVAIMELLRFGFAYEQYISSDELSFSSWKNFTDSGSALFRNGSGRFLFQAGFMLTSRDFTWLKLL